ncbi:lipid-A-disaccharide synthase N-terminal domain-containing protein [Chachezhania sediminis]|uniref:lipid-A-disaccharide synthase N-terminal domain-containing protein n=1 Tax=Chachezhania sediminis TaxID=2599291 RepID=UPI00131EA968|nr:lipid-A-disaccharide synthase N-terminal domain-containing protein [Chachezhania sediminis]
MIDWLISVFHVTTTAELVWVVVGLFGQLMFTMRFLIQWIASERQKKSVVPEMFWWFSIGGGLILFAYACYRADPVFLLGQSFGVVIYARNLWLLYAEKRANRA